MPIKAPPTKTICLTCRWSKVTHHSSDCLILPQQCQSCGSRMLEHNSAKGLEASSVMAALQKLLGS